MSERISFKAIAWILPIALLLTTYVVFTYAGKFLDDKTGYLIGFLFYWIIWCALVPSLLLSKREIKSMLKIRFSPPGQLRVSDLLLLLLPLVFAYLYAFPKAVQSATFPIVALSVVLALVNASLEEFLWRGLYLKLIGSNKWLYIFLSSIGFAIWHFAPQAIFQNNAPGGQISFVAFAFVLGILYSVVTYRTRSILPAIISHILLDFSGLGGRLYLM